MANLPMQPSNSQTIMAIAQQATTSTNSGSTSSSLPQNNTHVGTLKQRKGFFFTRDIYPKKLEMKVF